MSGQRLDIGEHGDVHYRDKPNGRVAASVYFRNAQGVRKRIEATGDSKASARRRLFATLGEAMAAGGLGYSPRSTFADVAADWLESLDELVEAGRRSPRTVALYRHALTRHVLPGLGGLRLSELTSARMDRFIRDRRRAAGYPVAKLCRSVTSGICAFAVRRDAPQPGSRRGSTGTPVDAGGAGTHGRGVPRVVDDLGRQRIGAAG